MPSCLDALGLITPRLRLSSSSSSISASNYVHYSEGYVVTPGYVDISDLVFATVEGGGGSRPAKIFPGKQRHWDGDGDGGDGDDYDYNSEDDDDDDGDDDLDHDDEGDEGRRQRILDEVVGGGDSTVRF